MTKLGIYQAEYIRGKNEIFSALIGRGRILNALQYREIWTPTALSQASEGWSTKPNP